jgi:hypothetical protein
MKIDTLFTSKSSGTLYAGTDDGDGKFSGQMIKDGRLTGKMQNGIPGTLVAKFVEPVEPNGKALPLHADIKVDGAGTAFGLGQYLTSLTRAQQRNAGDDE